MRDFVKYFDWEGLALLLIGFVIGLSVYALAIKYDKERKNDVEQTNELLAFKDGDCFVHNGQLEPWEPWVEGQIMAVGYKKYLIMSSDARIKQRYDGNYKGVEVEKGKFERLFHKVDCPKLWKGRVK